MPDNSHHGSTEPATSGWLGKTAVAGAVVAGLALGRGKGASGLIVGGLAAAAGLNWLSSRKQRETAEQSSLQLPDEKDSSSVPAANEASLISHALAQVEPGEFKKQPVGPPAEVNDDLLQQMLNPPSFSSFSGDQFPSEPAPVPSKNKAVKPDVQSQADDDMALLMGPLIWEQSPDLLSLSYSESETVWYGLHDNQAQTIAPVLAEPEQTATQTEDVETVSEEPLSAEGTDVFAGDPAVAEGIEIISELPEPSAVLNSRVEHEADDHLVEKLSAFLHVEDSVTEPERQVEPKVTPPNPFMVSPREDAPFVVSPKTAPLSATPAADAHSLQSMTRLLPIEDVEVRDVGSRSSLLTHRKMEPVAPAGRQTSVQSGSHAGWWWMTAVVLVVALVVAAIWWTDQRGSTWTLPFVGELNVVEDIITPDSLTIGTRVEGEDSTTVPQAEK